MSCRGHQVSVGSSLILNALFKYLLVVVPLCHIHSGEKRHPYREQKGAVNFLSVLEKYFLTLLTGSLCSSLLSSPSLLFPSLFVELTVGHGHLSETPSMQKQKLEKSQLLVTLEGLFSVHGPLKNHLVKEEELLLVGCSDSNFTLPELLTILGVSNWATLGFMAHQMNLECFICSP